MNCSRKQKQGVFTGGCKQRAEYNMEDLYLYLIYIFYIHMCLEQVLFLDKCEAAQLVSRIKTKDLQMAKI